MYCLFQVDVRGLLRDMYICTAPFEPPLFKSVYMNIPLGFLFQYKDKETTSNGFFWFGLLSNCIQCNGLAIFVPAIEDLFTLRNFKTFDQSVSRSK